MTPAARIAAAITCLDGIQAGAPAEKTLTTWARQNRYAGSGDRAAIRDLVFDALRRKRSYGWLGAGDTGRALMIGAARATEGDLTALFSGAQYAPSPLSEDEAAAPPPLVEAPEAVRFDCPDWLWPMMQRSLGDEAVSVLQALQSRAPVSLRVNRVKSALAEAVSALAEDEIDAAPHALCPTALTVTRNPRRVQQSRAYKEGLVELQDVASQAVVEAVLPLAIGARVLDYCAGGGGKALALAAGGAGEVHAHDAIPRRMSDIPARAARAGTSITVMERPFEPYDLVLCDAPCSGTGAWRRQPDAKWRLTEGRLAELNDLQDSILDSAADLVTASGHLAYVTCSLLERENEARVTAFLDRHKDWLCTEQRRFSPLDGGDGFFLAVLCRRGSA